MREMIRITILKARTLITKPLMKKKFQVINRFDFIDVI